jgi:RNA ligase
MKYQFPRIEHIDDIRAAIEGSPEFIIAERDDYIVVNYMVAMPDTFPEVKTAGGSAKMREEASRNKAIRRELRGIIFDKNGHILSRRLHKFFNVNERNETLMQHIDFSEPHVILEKLDGSMITPFFIGDQLRWGTKMGLTDVAKPVENFVAKHIRYSDFAREVIAENMTPIFEWCSRSQRIVIDYSIDRLVLIAIRNNVTGEYVGYDEMVNWSHKFLVECVKTYPGTAESMKHLIDSVRDKEGIEGYVLRFDDGHMIKIKGDWYVRIHKIKDAILHEKNLLDLIINEKIDDAKPFMLELDRERVEEFEKKFWKGIDDTIYIYEDMFRRFQHTYKDKKDFAIHCASTLNSLTKTIMFSLWDGKNARELVLDMVRRNLGTQTKVDSVRSLWYGYKWNYGEGNNE